MSLQDPIYDPKNPLKDFFQHFGHEVHEVEHAVVEAPMAVFHDAIVLNEDFKAQYPTLAADNEAVVSLSLELTPIWISLGLAATSGPLTIAAFGGAVVKIISNIGLIVKFFSAVMTLAKTLGTDLTTDAGQMKI